MKSFQAALENRVRGGEVDGGDFYTIKKAADNILQEVFGKRGQQNLEVKKINKKVLFIAASKSLWRSELALNKNLIIKQINKELKKRVVEKISVI